MRYSEKELKSNTNNAWGFGGVITTEFTYPNGTKRLKRERCYRHTGSHVDNTYYDADDNEISRKQFNELKKEFDNEPKDSYHVNEPKSKQQNLFTNAD